MGATKKLETAIVWIGYIVVFGGLIAILMFALKHP